MRRRAFIAVTILSLVMLAILSLGLLGTFGVIVDQHKPTLSPPINRMTSIGLDGGRLKIFIQDYPVTPAALPWPNTRMIWVTRFRPGSAFDRHAITGFDAHPLSVAGSTAYLFACPIWCLAIPFLIAPAVWFGKWRRGRKVEPAGFVVISDR